MSYHLGMNGLKNEWISPNCIQVDKSPNHVELKQNYLIDYKSNDGHKEKTKQADLNWRHKLGLQNIYDFEKTLPQNKPLI